MATYPITNYGDLKEAIPDFLNNSSTSLANAIPSFINSAMRTVFDNPDFRINPFRDTIELAASAEGVVYKPSDLLQAKHLYLSIPGYSPKVLTRVTYDAIVNSELETTGYPEYFADNGNSFILSPAPEAGTTIMLDYYFYPATLGSTGNVTASNYTLSANGTGYAVGDELTVTPTGGTAATFLVASVNVGVISGLSGQTAGSNFVKGTEYDLTSTTGAGTGAKITIPSVDNEANWLIINEPNLLVYGSCWEGALYLDNMEEAQKWERRFYTKLDNIIARQVADEFGGGSLVMSNGRGQLDGVHYNRRFL